MTGLGAPVLARAALRAALVYGFFCAGAQALAGVIRHDRDDQQYRDLGNLPEYQAVGQVRADVNGASRLCSGTLIAPDWVLTAGHCLSNTTAEGVFYQQLGQTLYASQIIVHPQFTGVPSGGSDLGLVRLASPSELFTPAQRMRDLIPLGATATIVGFGLTGDGHTGSVMGTQGVKRAGQNVVNVNGLRVESETGDLFPESVLFADFDNPDDAGDSAWGSSTPLDLEYQTAPGDSGGGWFVHHGGAERLYAVHSFGLAFDGANDNDYGDASAGTRVTRFNSWIDQQLGADYWNNPAGGQFAEASNWSNGATPPVNQTLRFAFPHAYNVAATGDQVISRLEVDRGRPTFAITSGTTRIHAANVAPDAAARFDLDATGVLQMEGDVSGGGPMSVSGAGEFRIAQDVTMSGALNVDGSRITLASGRTLHLIAPLEANANTTIHVNDGALLNTPSWVQRGELALNGGRLEVAGDMRQSAESVTSINLTHVVLDGASAPIAVGGDLIAEGGELRLSMDGIPARDPDVARLSSQVWTILTAQGALTGAFDSVDFSGLPEGFEFSVDYSDHAIHLTLEGLPRAYFTVPGDTNGDQVVDLQDLNNVRDHFGADRGLGDTNGDGLIDLGDVNAVRNHFGEQRLDVRPAVPEPDSLLVALTAFSALFALRRRL